MYQQSHFSKGSKENILKNILTASNKYAVYLLTVSELHRKL